MHRKTSPYPISRFIYRIFSDSKLSAYQLVEKLGYQNTSKGLRHFDNWLQKGFGSTFFIETFAIEFHIPRETITVLLEETEQFFLKEKEIGKHNRQERKKTKFVPYIYIQTSSSRPSIIFIAAMTNASMKYIRFSEQELEELLQLDFQEKKQYLKGIIQKHVSKNPGKCLLFGEVTGFVFVESWERYHSLNLDGEFMGTVEGIFERGFSCGVEV